MPQHHLNGIQTGLILSLYRRNKPIVRWASNRWSPNYGKPITNKDTKHG